MAFFRKLFRIGVNSKPWCVPGKDFVWTEAVCNDLFEKAKNIKPQNTLKDDKLNILVIGPKGQGKSSLINSVASISVNERTSVSVSAAFDDNVTTSMPGEFQYVRLCDVQGLTKKKDDAVCLLQNLRHIVHGHVKHGYELELNNPISEESESFIKEPTVESKMHFVIVVFDITEAKDIHSNYLDDIKKITKELNGLNVPYSVFLTKADTLCQRVNDDIENIFHSTMVIEAAENTFKAVRISRKNIHPVVNFEDNVRFGWKEKIPLLIALKSCLSAARDHLYNEETD